MSKINISLCLSDIPKGSITTTQAGKEYVNLTITPRKERGKFGETHSVSIKKTRYNLTDPAVYVGGGTEYGSL